MNIYIPGPIVLNIGLVNLIPTIRAASLEAVKLIPKVQISDIDLASLEIPKPETSISPDVVILGESETTSTTSKQIRFIHSHFGTSHIILVVHSHEGDPFGNFLESGAMGIVCTEAIPDLPDAIHAVKEGRLYLDVCQASHPLNLGKFAPSGEELKKFPQATDFLSSRENRVLFLVAKGHTNQQIAEHLGVSIKSIENDKGRIKERLGLETRADIVKFAMDQGLLNVDE